jgi:hypothetical protein
MDEDFSDRELWVLAVLNIVLLPISGLVWLIIKLRSARAR